MQLIVDFLIPPIMYGHADFPHSLRRDSKELHDEARIQRAHPRALKDIGKATYAKFHWLSEQSDHCLLENDAERVRGKKLQRRHAPPDQLDRSRAGYVLVVGGADHEPRGGSRKDVY